MTQVRLQRWGSKSASQKPFTINGIIREHEYYRCLTVTNQYKEKMLLWKLHGAANPFISLLDLYKLYALPTNLTISRQFIRFLVKCWKAFKEIKTMKDFKLQFYFCKFSKQRQSQIIEDEQIAKIMNMIESLDNEKLDRFAQQYDSPTLQSNKLLVEDCAYFQSRADENLRNLMIFAQQDKMDRLNSVCRSFLSLWNAQLLYDRAMASVYILTSNKLHPNKLDKTDQLFLLQDVLQWDQKWSLPIVISEQVIDKLVNNLLNQLDKFEKCNQEQWCYPLDIDTVFIKGRKDNGQLHITPDCFLDIMQPFLRAVGLTNRINTIESLIVFHSKPKPSRNSMVFAQVLTSHFKIEQPLEHSRIQLGIRWMVMAEFMFQSSLQLKGKSVLQAQRYKVKTIEALMGVNGICPIHPAIKMLINLIKLKYPEIDSPEDLLKKLTIKNIVQANKDEDDDFKQFEENRYGVIKNSIDLKVKLYFESFKQFCEKNKTIKTLDSKGKYITLYLLAHYAFLETERQFVQLWMGQPVQILQDKNPLYAALTKFIRITPKIEAQVQKIDKDTARWDSEIRQNMESILEYCKTLKGRLFGSSCHNLTAQNRQNKLEQLTVMVSQIKEKIQYIWSLFRKDFEKEVDSQMKLNSKSTSSYLNGRKNLCFMSIFISLDLYNYSDLYCEQTAIRKYQQPSKQTTKGDIKEKFDQIQTELVQCIARGGQFKQETHTSLSKHQFIQTPQ